MYSRVCVCELMCGCGWLIVELERLPDPTRRQGPEEKLAVNKPNTRYYPGPKNWPVGLFDWLNRAQKIVTSTGPE